jgi:hypothetical protein
MDQSVGPVAEGTNPRLAAPAKGHGMSRQLDLSARLIANDHRTPDEVGAILVRHDQHLLSTHTGGDTRTGEQAIGGSGMLFFCGPLGFELPARSAQR